MMWANLHLLFWLSLFPFVTGWMGENHFTPVPTALYGVVLLLAAIAYYILQCVIIAEQGRDSKLAASIGRDFKGKLSPALYAIAIAASFFRPWMAGVHLCVRGAPVADPRPPHRTRGGCTRALNRAAAIRCRT